MHISGHESGVLGRWLSSHYHTVAINEEKSGARNTVNLLTSTIKPDAEQSDLRFSFRIISTVKAYTLQAEKTVDQKDWIDKTRGVIAFLLTSEAVDGRLLMRLDQKDTSSARNHASEGPFIIVPSSAIEEGSSNNSGHSVRVEKPIELLTKVAGNDRCADCGAPGTDWASLNLGLLICIECSGVHRNLDVHISKVRSLTLDVKVWKPSVISLFQSLGNVFANSVLFGLWQQLLPLAATYIRSLVHYHAPLSFVSRDFPFVKLLFSSSNIRLIQRYVK